MNRAFFCFAFLYLAPLFAMEEEIVPWQEILSQEIIDAVAGGDKPKTGTISIWRERYEALMASSVTTKSFNAFFEPIAQRIYQKFKNKYIDKLMTEDNSTCIYNLKFHKFVEKSLTPFYERELNLCEEVGNKFLSIGREPHNAIVIDKSHLQVSRLHLIIARLPNGAGLVLDPFSTCGSEEVQLEEIGFDFFKFAQKRDNDLSQTGKKRDIFIKVFSPQKRLLIRIGMDLLEISAR